MAGFGNSQDLVEIEDIKEDVLLLKDGSLRQIIMVGGINFSLKSEEEQNALILAYQNFLNSVDFPMQIVIHSRKINVSHYLDDLSARSAEEQSPLLQNQITEYREFIRQFVQENAIMEKTFLVVVSWYPAVMGGASGGIFSGLPFFKKKEDPAKREAELNETFRQNKAQLAERVNQVLSGLAAMGLETIILKKEELTELFYNFYNPGTIEKDSATAPTNK